MCKDDSTGNPVALLDCMFEAGETKDSLENYHVKIVTSLPEVLKKQNQQIIEDWLESDFTGDFSSAALCTYIIHERHAMAIELKNLKKIDDRLFDMFKDKGRPQ